MIVARLSSSVLCLALAGLALAQAPRGREAAQEKTSKPSFYSDQFDAESHKAMQGVWKVEQVEWLDGRRGGRDVAGYMLVAEGHLSLEIHVRTYFGDNEEWLLQTGIYRYRFSETGEMEMVALIGTDTVEDYDITPTEPGQISRFRVRLAGDVMIFDRPTSKLTMRRTVQPKPPFFEEAKELPAEED